MPRSPWLASAGWTKAAGWPVEARVAAILRATWPDLPMPVTMTRPRRGGDRLDRGREGRAELALAGPPHRLAERVEPAPLDVEGSQRRRQRARMFVNHGELISPAAALANRPGRRASGSRRAGLNGSRPLRHKAELAQFLPEPGREVVAGSSRKRGWRRGSRASSRSRRCRRRTSPRGTSAGGRARSCRRSTGPRRPRPCRPFRGSGRSRAAGCSGRR